MCQTGVEVVNKQQHVYSLKCQKWILQFADYATKKHHMTILCERYRRDTVTNINI